MLYLLNPKKPQAIFCDCTARFVSDLVGNSCNAAHSKDLEAVQNLLFNLFTG